MSIIWFIKTFTYVVVNLFFLIFVFVKHSELLIVLRRYNNENFKTPEYEHILSILVTILSENEHFSEKMEN